MGQSQPLARLVSALSIWIFIRYVFGFIVIDNDSYFSPLPVDEYSGWHVGIRHGTGTLIGKRVLRPMGCEHAKFCGSGSCSIDRFYSEDRVHHSVVRRVIESEKQQTSWMG